MPSISRTLAKWVTGIKYEDLPSAVIDRAKGVTLHSLASVLLGSQLPGGQPVSYTHLTLPTICSV